MQRNPSVIRALLTATLFSFLAADGQAAEKKAATAPFPYVQAKAFHIPPDTTTEESGYFSLCEGRNGKIYVGTAAYGRNSYLVEFDPATETVKAVK